MLAVKKTKEVADESGQTKKSERDSYSHVYDIGDINKTALKHILEREQKKLREK